MANPSTNTKRLTTLILWAIAWAAAMIASAILNAKTAGPSTGTLDDESLEGEKHRRL